MGKHDRIPDEELSGLDRNTRTEVKRLEKLLRSAMTKGNTSEQSKLCNTLGGLLGESGLLALALQYHTQDLALSQQHGAPLDIGVAHRKVGEVFAELGEFSEAVSHQETFLRISVELGDLIEQQRAHATLGRTYYTQVMSVVEEEDVVRLRKKSAEHYRTALDLTHTLRSKRLLSDKEIMEMKARLHLNIGLLYDKVSPELSKSYLSKAQTEAKANRDYTIQHLALLQLCDSHIHQQQLVEAICYGDQAVKCAQQSKNRSELAASYELLSLAQIHSKKLQLARENAKNAVKIDSDLITAMRVYKVTKLIMSTEQIDFGETERELTILSKITDILMKLSLYSHSIPWLQRRLGLAKTCHVTSEAVAEIHGKLGDCLQETEDYELSAYHYTQQISLVSTTGTWIDIARVSMKNNQPYQDCYDAVRAGLSEATTPSDYSTCWNTLIEIGQQFGRGGDVEEARGELEKVEEEETCTVESSQEQWSDAEISESETDDVEEGEGRGKRRGKIGRVNEKGETPLHQACIEGRVEKVRELLSKHASPNTRDHAGWTPLHEACNLGHLQIVKLLVSAGADLNDRGGKVCGGITPLHDAAQWGFVEIVRYLVEHGASLLAKDEEGRDPFQLVTDVTVEEPGSEINDDRTEVIRYLAEVARNPPKVRVVPAVQRKGGNEELFTRESFSSPIASSTQRPLVSEGCSRQRPFVSEGCSEQRRNRADIRKRRLPSKMPRSRDTGSRDTGSRKPSVTPCPIVDDWLVDDVIPSPKRKTPSDPFRKTNENKRSRQSRLAVAKMDLNASPETPEIIEVPTPSTPVQPNPTATDHPKLRVKIKVRDQLFLIPVKPSQTITDLASDAAQRYRTKLGILPTLTLTTSDGAELDSTDIASQLLVDGEELVGVVEEAHHVGILDKYMETCQKLAVQPTLKEMFSGSVSNITVRRAPGITQHLECLFTTILCCTSIKHLDLSFNRLSKESLTTFFSVLPTLTGLQDLDISGCGVNNTNFLKLSSSLSGLSLHSLTLDYNGISNCFTALLELINNTSSLIKLSAANCTIRTAAEISPELSHKFSESGLTHLNISQNLITHYPTFPQNLTSLVLGGTPLEPTNITFPSHLSHLTLSNCTLTDSNFRALLGSLTTLTEFRAPFNHVTSEAVVDLVMLFPRLQLLDLSSNPLTAEGIETLSLVAPPTVILQNCRGSDVTSDVITAMYSSVELCDLSYNRIDYPRFCKELDDDVREAVQCQGNKLVIKKKS